MTNEHEALLSACRAIVPVLQEMDVFDFMCDCPELAEWYALVSE